MEDEIFTLSKKIEYDEPVMMRLITRLGYKHVTEFYKAIAENEPDRVIMIDASVSAEEVFASVINELKKHYEDKLFDTNISRNVKLTEAPGFGRPVYYYDKNAKGAKEYLDVAKQLTERI